MILETLRLYNCLLIKKKKKKDIGLISNFTFESLVHIYVCSLIEKSKVVYYLIPNTNVYFKNCLLILLTLDIDQNLLFISRKILFFICLQSPLPPPKNAPLVNGCIQDIGYVIVYYSGVSFSMVLNSTVFYSHYHCYVYQHISISKKIKKNKKILQFIT